MVAPVALYHLGESLPRPSSHRSLGTRGWSASRRRIQVARLQFWPLGSLVVGSSCPLPVDGSASRRG